MGRDLTIVKNIYVFLLFLVTCVLWGLSMTYNHHLDGIAVYTVGGGLPFDKPDNILPKKLDSDRSKNKLTAMLNLLPVCVFPAVYNQLKDLTEQQAVAYLTGRGLTDTSTILNKWNGIDFSTWDNPYQLPGQPISDYNMPYNLPYVGLEADKPLNPQYFSPACRCINEVLDVYGSGNGTHSEATDAMQACLATRYHILQQTRIGNRDSSSSDITQHKYISRHALLFNLCAAIFFSMAYNMMEFNSHETNYEFFRHNMYSFIYLFVLTFCIPFVSQTFSARAVNPLSSMQFSALVHLPAAVIFLAVEWMWSHVAKEYDVRRQTYLHPYSFYTILVNLHIIALIENGVFTYHVIATFIMLSIITALAYTAVLFAAHGKLWQVTRQDSDATDGELPNLRPFRTGELTGYIIILILVAITDMFHMIPAHPINSELNFLWLLPMIFAIFCFVQIVLLEHLMGEDTDDAVIDYKVKKLQFSNSVHLVNTGHNIVIALVILYYVMQMHYVWHGDLSMLNTGGRVDKRLNFELAELKAVPSYTNLHTAPGNFLGTA
jgi:hypothetical protein